MERRTVTSREATQQLTGSTYIAPGIWIDANGGLHFSVPELLALVDLPDTVGNREAVVALVEKILLETQSTASVVRQDIQDA